MLDRKLEFKKRKLLGEKTEAHGAIPQQTFESTNTRCEMKCGGQVWSDILWLHEHRLSGRRCWLFFAIGSTLAPGAIPTAASTAGTLTLAFTSTASC